MGEAPMITYPCTCSWGIPGVERLPEHHHYQHPREFAPGVMRMEDRILIHVDWYQVARELAAMVPRDLTTISTSR